MPNPGVGLVHPGLAASVAVAGFFPQRVTIQASTATTNTFGETTLAWEALANHVDIPARMAPGQSGQGSMAREQELRRADQTLVTDPYRIGLNRWCPDITTGHRALVKGVAYDILTVEADAQSGLTWLTCEVTR